MSRKHPSFEQLERKRININAELKKMRPVLTFEEILVSRKARHNRLPCDRKDCALKNSTPEEIRNRLIAKELDTKKLQPQAQG